MFCTSCGKQFEGNFCPNCGARASSYQQPTTGKNDEAQSSYHCSKCGSSSLKIEKRGFGIGKAIIAGMFFPPAILAAGFSGSKNDIVVCQNCGNKEPLEKVQIRENQARGIPCCPKCGSIHISANQAGFSAGKAVLGREVFGTIGLAAGSIGSKKVTITCLNCGHQWRP